MLKVAINGYGTIGKRVADAIRLQDDMQVVGVTLTKPSFKALVAIQNGFDLYSAVPGTDFGEIEIKGDINDLVQKADVVVDCSPGGVGAENKALYVQAGKKALFQGGEKADIADISFNAQTNFEQAKGKDYVRIVSCNTTGLCRSLGALHRTFGIKSSYVVLVRRTADPHDSKTGPVNAIVPEMRIPSHHGPDVQSVIPDLPITTAAVKVPTTLMHVHVVRAKLARAVERKDIIDLFENTTRIVLVSKSLGIKSTAELMEWAREIGRKRSDLYEIAIWEESINVDGDNLYFIQAVHQEADVVPENIDALRAMFGQAEKEESITKTNKSLGIK